MKRVKVGEYGKFLNEIKLRIASARVRATISINHELKLAQLVPELPWGHNVLIMQKLKSEKEREYYLSSAVKFGWSRNILLNQIKADAYRLSLRQKIHNFPKALPVHISEQADEAMKSVYNLDFLGLTRPILERELEKRLVEKIKHFILELGFGFSFIGNQYHLALGDNEYFVDLLFYNRRLKCLVAIELIGVAEYYLTRKLPKMLKGKLPDAESFRLPIQEELKH